MEFEYLLFNLLVTIGPLAGVCAFRKISRLPKGIPALFAILITATLFIFLDHQVTDVWWRFNPNYILKIFRGNLPIEELIFFFSVPFACLILWVNLKDRTTDKVSVHVTRLFTLGLWGMLWMGAVIYKEAPYTRFVLITSACIPVLDILLRTYLLRSRAFLFFIFGITNALTLVFNGYLTARPIVRYNPTTKSGFNIMTIPFEDFIFGMVLISLTLILYEFFVRKLASSHHVKTP